MNRYRIFTKFVVFTLTLLLYGCGFWESAPQSTSAEQAKNAQAAGAETGKLAGSPSRPEQPGDIEVLWQIPSDPVQRYMLRYGSSPTELTHEVPLEVSTLQKFDHPQYGFVYRYLLSGVEESGPVYISLVAMNAGQASEPATAVRVREH